MKTSTEQNKNLVLEAFDTLFNKARLECGREALVAQLHPAQGPHPTGTRRLFQLIKSMPPTLKYESGTIVADGGFVIVHGRYSGFQPPNWIVADVVRMKDGVLAEHWDVIQDEATKEQSKSGLPMFGAKFGK